MGGIYTVEELAYKCYDFSTHAGRIEAIVGGGGIIVSGDGNLDAWRVLESIKEDDGDFVNQKIANMSIHAQGDRKFLAVFDEKLTELAEIAARTYKGKYDE